MRTDDVDMAPEAIRGDGLAAMAWRRWLGGDAASFAAAKRQANKTYPAALLGRTQGERASMTTTIGVREAVAGDTEACGRVIFEAFRALAERHGFPPDFPSADAAAGMVGALLASPTAEGLVAERDGRLVGCNFIDLAHPVAGVGPIAVSPSAQDGGIGRRLMTAALDRAEAVGLTNVRLAQAAYNNASLSLYTTLGFEAQALLSVMQGPPPAERIEGHHVRPASEADVPVCDRLCRSVIGFERTGDLRAAIAAGNAMIVNAREQIVGYTTGVGFPGHTVTEDNEGLKALICAAPTFAGPGFLLPTTNRAVLNWCLGHGLRLVMQMTYMTIGLHGAADGGWLPSIMR